MLSCSLGAEIAFISLNWFVLHMYVYPHNLINTFGLDCSAECGKASSARRGGARAVNIARRSIEMLSQRAMFY